MKKSDIAILILIVSVSALIAYFSGSAILGASVGKPVQVETADAISSDVVTPSNDIFNANAINPTVPIQIGGGSNQQPF